MSIKNLYQVFSKSKPQLSRCSPATPINPELKNILITKPLVQLTDEELSGYLYKACTTWGTVDDFKYFLPRLLELFANDDDTIFSKIAYAYWTKWEAEEQNALRNFFKDFWINSLCSNPAQKNIENVLIKLALVEADLTPYLKIWENFGDSREESHGLECSLKHLRVLISDNSLSLIANKKLSHSSWRNNAEAERQISQWLLSPDTYRRFFSRWEDRQYSQAVGADEGWLQETLSTLQKLEKNKV